MTPRPKLHAGDMERAVAALLNVRVYVIVPNIKDGLHLGHEVDLLAMDKLGRFTEIEIKISRADLKRDKHKGHDHESKFISRLIFAVPADLVELARKEIPPRAGIISVALHYQYPVGHKKHSDGWALYKASWVKMVKHDKTKKAPPDWWRLEILRLGCMRIWSLKEALHRCQARHRARS